MRGESDDEVYLLSVTTMFSYGKELVKGIGYPCKRYT